MTKLEDLKLDSFTPKICLYGPPGSGKTAFCLTGGDLVEYVDLDNGLLTGKTFKDKFTSERGKVSVFQSFDTEPGKTVGFSKAQSYIRGLVTLSRDPNCKWKILVIDSFTALCSMAMRNVMSSQGRIDATPQLQHWGMAFAAVEGIMQDLKAVQKIVILVAHQQTSDEDGISQIEISIPGQKLAPRVIPYIDEIWHCKVLPIGGGKVDYILQTSSTGSIMTRSRLNVPTGTSMNLGLREVLKLGGIVL